ncbi:MAG TPA: serine acetyltransferase [Acidimicrobiales bacterium]|nr:serine acetyltransferase [Acidimicrobiales bacterium]
MLERIARAVLDRLEPARALATLPLLLGYKATDQREVIDADVSQWLAVMQADDGKRGLHSLLYAFPEFRSLYYYRLGRGNAKGALAAKALRLAYRPVRSLDLACRSIGPGLFVAHGDSTILNAESIGRNCFIHQRVTIGWDYRSERSPILGDGVFVGTGASVLGAVTIGDGARIGANAVVLCDVPAGYTAVGVPAKLLPPARATGAGADGAAAALGAELSS